jgi:hypothetical protein
MSIQKKSLLSTLNTTKKAIVASSTTPAQGTPSVNAPISARIMPRTKARIMPRTRARVMSRTKARIKAV